MKNILVIFGTRPEVIKLAPVILELKKYPNKYNVIVCNTEQQKELSNQTLEFFNIAADINLNVMSPNQTLAGVQALLLQKIATIFINYAIDATIVQGDTMSVFCGALASFYSKIPVFHVEAGLRSNNLFEPFPEEALRVMTSRITTLHFAPTINAKIALKKENILAKKITVTGNTVIDALHCLSSSVLNNVIEELKNKHIIFNDKLVLVTVHRRENHGERLKNILQAIKDLALQFMDHQFILPVHPNPNVKDAVYSYLQNLKNVILLEPLDYPYLVSIMKHSKLVLTDSGGIQEEAPAFGTPVLVMRYETERMEGVDAGFATLVGADYKKIFDAAEKILQSEKSVSRTDSTKNPYGDGTASIKIVKAIDTYFKKDKK